MSGNGKVMEKCWRLGEKTVISRSLKITDIEKIFGHLQKDKTINKVILATKIIIYKSRIADKSHHITMVKRQIFNELRIEEYEANLNNTIQNFTQVWEKMYANLKNLFLV